MVVDSRVTAVGEMRTVFLKLLRIVAFEAGDGCWTQTQRYVRGN